MANGFNLLVDVDCPSQLRTHVTSVSEKYFYETRFLDLR